MSTNFGPPPMATADDTLLDIQFHEIEHCDEASQVWSLHLNSHLTKRLLKTTNAPSANTMADAQVHKKHRRGTPSSVDDSSPICSKASASQARQTGNQKKPETKVAHSSLLHQSCRLFAQTATVIQSSVDMEPHQACQRATKAPTGSSYLVGDGREPYSLPINILLNHQASLESVLVMAKAAPKALVLKDGRDEGCSVVIALRLFGKPFQKKDNGKSIAEALLEVNPEAAQVHDRRRNFPLHVASYVGASFDMISSLYWAFPEALLEKNFHGETPLDIAIRNGMCEDRVTNFLHEKINHLKTARLQRASLS